MAPELFTELATSLLLGLLVGLQRQRAESAVGGIRTYPLIAAFGEHRETRPVGGHAL